ncbi:sulfite exporter TauE/SafE family protein [Clostridium tagluense]|uniref:sulfite exporter TauE/SafE family protein n=1 Tax=Clostridium tagluense TaxID=360422 RepID=UPI001CF3DA37|nr:sulfite exporter TauE/SafE family protein [Clostridium tagluense]MCB2311200.1 sulfite exporter TauE/SafE family protein [Clostridium tagluense]MCB2315924.1 sulfite exporter TauE/SafE family protein [Clostridium tagluense]MCB2320729.1 sulfite exporter TauE/SafE family protein [Clostridium tagluense]MCB2325746.1 sulfite exporter TauE/SafE family protein [Clostridium tagluense]MCB2330516.1 sulfite exporter TauE/SafE family protein [Clostridium tagluense]
MLTAVLSALGLLTLYFAIIFIRDYMVALKEGRLEKPSFLATGAVGFATNFFDTLGIGSFAPTTALLKQFKLTDDRTLPGTLNVSATIPVVVEAFIFITVIKVDSITLVALLGAAAIGAVLGAGVVAKLDVKKIQLAMGVALMVVAVIMILQQLKIFPAGGDAIGLSGIKLIVAVIANFILGALMTLGIGLYAPCMALVYALGLSPTVAFPIMMGSCAFLMPAASIKFVKEGAYDRKASMAITVFGVLGVFIAAYLVKSLPLNILRWVVIVVIIYTSAMMFKSFKKPAESKA